VYYNVNGSEEPIREKDIVDIVYGQRISMIFTFKFPFSSPLVLTSTIILSFLLLVGLCFLEELFLKFCFFYNYYGC
jgi:hypothetical protein